MDTQAVLPIKYFGFASYDNSLARFFYNCKDDHIFQKGSLNNQSPLQVKNEIASVDLRNCMCAYLFTVNLILLIFHSISFYFYLVLVTKCRFYSVKPDSADYDYKDYIKTSDIANSQPDGYILRLVLFIQGGRDANILLTTSNQPNFERDFVYEIIIGGWGNEVSLQKQKQILTKVYKCLILKLNFAEDAGEKEKRRRCFG